MAEEAYTPDLVESDAGLGRIVLYEEPGARKGMPAGNALAPCEACGVPVILGALEDGTRLAVEQETRIYVLSWQQKAVKGAPNPPTFTQSRGYPAHTCRRGDV